MLLPVRSKNPPESLPIVTLCLIAINTIVFFATQSGLGIRRDVMYLWGLKSSNFDIPHLFSSMFLHGDLFHLLGNMWFLYLFGFAVEGRLRSLKFSILYILGGIGAALLHHFVVGQFAPNQVLIGASGAIMGILGAALYMFPHAKVTMFYWYMLIRIGTADWAMWCVGLFYLGFDLLWGAIGLKDGVAHFAHLGGAITAMAICLVLRVPRDSELVSEAKATLAETKDLRTLSRLELEELHRINPNDTTIILNWLNRSLREPGGVRDNCREAFIKALPRILEEQDVNAAAQGLAWLATEPGKVPSNVLFDAGTRLERAGNGQFALRMYDMVTKDPNAAESDLQAAAFRIGMLSETVNRDLRAAYNWYGYIVQRWPMGPLADQAKARMAAITQQAQAQQAKAQGAAPPPGQPS